MDGVIVHTVGWGSELNRLLGLSLSAKGVGAHRPYSVHVGNKRDFTQSSRVGADTDMDTVCTSYWSTFVSRRYN